jgi:hypothetical protein
MRVTVDRFVNPALLVVCLLMAANASLQLLDRLGARQPPIQPAQRAAPQPSYQPGDTVPAVNGHSYASAKGTFLLIVRSTCTFCTRSMPFYRRLAEAARERDRFAKLIVLSAEPKEIVAEYFKTHGVAIDSIGQVPDNYLRVAGTPTLILVDSGGRVQKVWLGLLASQQEATVLAALEKMSEERS